jgi:hypothetical protein
MTTTEIKNWWFIEMDYEVLNEESVIRKFEVNISMEVANSVDVLAQLT